MEDSPSSSRYNETNSDSEESQIIGVPQIQKSTESINVQRNKSSGQYVKVTNKSQNIDQEAIIEEFRKRQEQERKARAYTPNVARKKKIEKLPANPSNKFDLLEIKKKWKSEMDKFIEKYKEYLMEQKKSYHGKQKQYLLDFYKVLLDGIYELKDRNEQEHNDLTLNEKKIIHTDCDFDLYLKDLVNKFDQAFRQAKVNKVIDQTKDKWDPLIKNCKDETNFELRRKIIRSKIKPINVLQNNNEFLMSEQTKLKEERRKQLILKQAFKNFEKPLEQVEEPNRIELQQQEINELPEPLESLRSIPSNDQIQKRISLEREKLEEFKQFTGEEFSLTTKRRIVQLLAGSPSYDRIMTDFMSKFQNV